MKNKKKLIFFSITVLVIFIIFTNFNSIRSYLRHELSHEFKISVKEFFFGKQYLDEIAFYRKINYNQKVLPKTQFENINFEIKEIANIEILKNAQYNSNIKKFFIDVFGDNLILVSVKGKIKLIKNFNLDNTSNLITNLSQFDIHQILDISVITNNLFISFASKENQNDKCSFFNVVKAQLGENNLNFENFYQTNKCMTTAYEYGGRMVYFNLNNNDGLLLTLAATDKDSHLAQDDKSPYGKILFFNLKNKKPIIMSKGHRNPQGLLVDDGIILSTEHGPYGGDEINKIILNGNYGWPNASYGESYNFSTKVLKTRSDYVFKKNHKKLNFIEPIYSFVPSIGISEIIKIPNDFSKYWQNNYFVTSLNGRSLYRILFDENFSKVIFYEKIPIGERIRDIKYIPKIKSFILTLEESGSLGFLKVKK